MSRATRVLLPLVVAASLAALGAGAARADDAVQAGTLYQSSDLCVYAIAATQHGPYTGSDFDHYSSSHSSLGMSGLLSYPLCGVGYYGTYVGAYEWNGACYGGWVWSGYHFEPSAA